MDEIYDRSAGEKIYGGSQGPKLILSTGMVYLFPPAYGENKRGLTQFRFTPYSANKYKSEGNRLIVVGETYQFFGLFKWSPLPKVYLKRLYDAQPLGEHTLFPWADKEDISFKIRLTKQIKEEPYEGITEPGSSPGYTVEVEFEGTEFKDAAGWGALMGLTGYGTNYGEDPGNQSP